MTLIYIVIMDISLMDDRITAENENKLVDAGRGVPSQETTTDQVNNKENAEVEVQADNRLDLDERIRKAGI